MHHDKLGTGPAVLFLHPGVGDSGVWEPQRAAFAGELTVVRCDLPGFGQTPIEQATISPAREAAALLEGLGPESVAIVGNSLGGRVALEVAVARPELVSALVLVGVL